MMRLLQNCSDDGDNAGTIIFIVFFVIAMMAAIAAISLLVCLLIMKQTMAGRRESTTAATFFAKKRNPRSAKTRFASSKREKESYDQEMGDNNNNNNNNAMQHGGDNEGDDEEKQEVQPPTMEWIEEQQTTSHQHLDGQSTDQTAHVDAEVATDDALLSSFYVSASESSSVSAPASSSTTNRRMQQHSIAQEQAGSATPPVDVDERISNLPQEQLQQQYKTSLMNPSNNVSAITAIRNCESADEEEVHEDHGSKKEQLELAPSNKTPTFVINVPPGVSLGLSMANSKQEKQDDLEDDFYSHGHIVTVVQDNSVLAADVMVGDELIDLDGIDLTTLSTNQMIVLLRHSAKTGLPRKLTIYRPNGLAV